MSDLTEGMDSGLARAADGAPSTGFRPSLAVRQRLGRLARRLGFRTGRAEAESTLVSQYIPGWFSIKEAEVLYLLGATCLEKRFLEIGHFVGRSTSALCEGIRDSGAAVEFNSYDLGFKDPEEFIAYYRRFYQDTEVPIPAECHDLVFSQRLTTTEIARRNLARFGLDRYVQLIAGDFTRLDPSRYGLIFCDAVHFPTEIAHMIPHVVAASNDDCLWALHDMNRENVAAVQQLAPARLIRLVDTLGVFRFHRTGPARSGAAV